MSSKDTFSGSAVVQVLLRDLDGHAINLRPGTTDGEGVVATFVGRFHRPSTGLRSVQVIWDLGANIGLTMADLAVQYPDAQIFGVELDRSNLELAERNVEPWADRCHLLHAAVWPDDGIVSVTSNADADGNRVAVDGDRTVTALSPGTLLQRTGPPDFVKMDIEGAERELLSRPSAWAAMVKCVNVECHGDYTLYECVSDLQRLGFVTHKMPRRPWRRGRPAVRAFRPGP
jgi:FkbM family methyltransferase